MNKLLVLSISAFLSVLFISCYKQIDTETIKNTTRPKEHHSLLMSPSTNQSSHRESDAENVRLVLAKALISFKTSLQPFYEQSSSYNDFKAVIFGDANHVLSTDAENLLYGAYYLIENNISDEEVLTDYEGQEMAAAVRYLYDRQSMDLGADFFNYTPTGNEFSRARECKWYQIGCHINNVIEWVENTIYWIDSYILHPHIPTTFWL